MKQSSYLCWGEGVLLLLAVGLLTTSCRKEAVAPEPLARGLKTLVIREAADADPRSFPGRVLAGQRVDLAFEVPGRIVELLVRSGDPVTNRQVIARLDPGDFQNALEAATAELQRAQARFERVQEAAELNAVSQQELTDARATMEVARAQHAISERNLEETVLRARFNGMIADRFVDNFQTILGNQGIVSLQDVREVEIETYIPESLLINMTQADFATRRPGRDIEAVFDFVPGVRFPLEVKEFATQADPVTQTYRVVLSMPSPTNYTVLAGMSATVLASPKHDSAAAGNGFAVPLSAVPVDGATGRYHVWLVRDGPEDQATVHKQFVNVGTTGGDTLRITSGLNPGDRIALAGVSLLREGETVRVLEDENGL